MRALLLPMLTLGTAGCACGGDKACKLDGGEYFVIEPAGWDGSTRLPVVLTAHGFGGTTNVILSRSDIADPYSDAGILWVVPQGADNSWNTRSSPEDTPEGRDDMAWLGAVLDEVAEQWPIDRDRVAASGFSQGASMASDLACYDPDRWPVAMPVSGTFWRSVPERCNKAIPVRHTHGTTDTTWPMEGRPIGSWHQGSVAEAEATWTATGSCDGEPETVMEGDMACTVYSGCTGGDVRVCLHDGAHRFPDDEAPRQVAWLENIGWW